MPKWTVLIIFLFASTGALAASNVDLLRQRVVSEAQKLLETTEISYVFGGRSLGEASDCVACNQCLQEKQPDSKARLKMCPQCDKCSLDCSHFTQLVFQRAGLPTPYFTTSLMAELSQEVLGKRYKFAAVGNSVDYALPGDLLVYRGHVVLLERMAKPGFGDIIHVTSGLELKGPGTAIQRLRHVDLANFRGPLVRILRHISLYENQRESQRPSGPRLRPIRSRGS